MRIHLPLVCFALLASAATATTALGQGALTPPGAPAPTMKTLDQLSAQIAASEARTPLSPADFGPGGAYTIAAPGSYYLTGNVSSAAVSGSILQIGASHVTLDLNGFTLAATGEAHGIGILNNQTNLTIRNGSIVGPGVRTVGTGAQPWEGTFAGTTRRGILTFGRSAGTETSSNIRLENLTIRGFFVGVQIRGFEEVDGNRHQLRGLRVFDCGDGIETLLCNLEDVVVQRCSGFGIRASWGNLDGIVATQIGGVGIEAAQAVLTRITVRHAGGDGIQGGNLVVRDANVSGASVGISGNGNSVDGAVLTNNRSHGMVGTQSTVRGVRAHQNGGAGIYCDESVITQSIATANGDDGIRGVGSVIVGCRASGNDTNAGGYVASGIFWSGGRIADSLADTASPAIP